MESPSLDSRFIRISEQVQQICLDWIPFKFSGSSCKGCVGLDDLAPPRPLDSSSFLALNSSKIHSKDKSIVDTGMHKNVSFTLQSIFQDFDSRRAPCGGPLETSK